MQPDVLGEYDGWLRAGHHERRHAERLGVDDLTYPDRRLTGFARDHGVPALALVFPAVLTVTLAPVTLALYARK